MYQCKNDNDMKMHSFLNLRFIILIHIFIMSAYIYPQKSASSPDTFFVYDTITLNDTIITNDTTVVSFSKNDTLISKTPTTFFDFKDMQSWIAVLGLFIALITVIITIVSRWDSAKPIINIRREINYHDKDGKRFENDMAELSLFICNTGLGPAKINSVSVLFNNKEIENKNTVYGPLEDLAEKYKTEMGDKVDKMSFNILWFQKGNSINAQNHHRLFSFMFNRKEEGSKLLTEVLSKTLFKLTYQSIYFKKNKVYNMLNKLYKQDYICKQSPVDI